VTTYTKGGQIRTAETPAQEVALQFDGWRQARPADPDPPAPPPAADLGPEPTPDTDAPPAGGKPGGRQTGTRGGAKNSG
jgi:hypothetical protein